ncbi:hypothetical protein AB0C13_38105, partial [Streptomyces sp. NPDC049099]|uniref:hypothetical protein n=1 Tax=Streptomyces sp. NPDC049099 TaxID=3155768 RepID=UPI00342CA1CD
RAADDLHMAGRAAEVEPQRVAALLVGLVDEAVEGRLRSSLLRASILRVWGQEQAARDLLDQMVENAGRVGGERAARQWRAEADRLLRERPDTQGVPRNTGDGPR